jgi:hypothetical protein
MYVGVFFEGAVTDGAGNKSRAEFGDGYKFGYDVVTFVSLAATPTAGCQFTRW